MKLITWTARQRGQLYNNCPGPGLALQFHVTIREVRKFLLMCMKLIVWVWILFLFHKAKVPNQHILEANLQVTQSCKRQKS